MMEYIRAFHVPLHFALQYSWYPLVTIFKSLWKALGALRPPSHCEGSCQQSSLLRRQPGTETLQNELPTHPSNVTVIKTLRYCPPQVTSIISRGGGNFIGLINDTTVLKYPCAAGNMEGLEIEARLLEAYIDSKPSISLWQRLQWCRQAAEAVEHIHQRNIIHCDINLRNFLLDDNLDLLLADFQGMLKTEDGATILDGLSRECSKSFAPRSHGDYADRKTDLFALGSAIYFIMMGHEIFPDLSNDDDDEIAARFQNEQFPKDNHACAQITEKCWKQQYESAADLLFDIVQIQLSLK
ncbi:kinase-like protein, partial [Aspergillus indologenus CBS 114.80]